MQGSANFLIFEKQFFILADFSNLYPRIYAHRNGEVKEITPRKHSFLIFVRKFFKKLS